MPKQYDFIVFGASGFTGKHVVVELFKKGYNDTYKIALAGRSKKKLEAVMDWMKIEDALEGEVGYIEANTNDHQSLVEMCKQGKAILNCVGPYRFHGEAVVKACLEGRADYLDITGEPEFMERMRVKYNDEAVKKGVYIIVACGFDCIPSEIGVIYCKKQFRGTLGAVENYFKIWAGRDGMTGNYGTYSSLVNSISSASALRQARKSQNNKHVPLYGPKQPLKHIHYSEKERKYALAFFGADVSVVRRSQRFFYEQRDEIPSQFSMYYCAGLLQIICIIIFMLVLKVFTMFSWGTQLLLDHPSFFSAGKFTKIGPTRQQIKDAGFKFTMYCKGYDKPAERLEPDTKEPYNKEMIVRITGPEIGYDLTPIALVQSSICVAAERERLPGTGGVFTPGPAFHDTTLIDGLSKNGVTFQILESGKATSS